jgi:hypothetical protein
MTCFYTAYSPTFEEVGKGLVNSIKKFYPDIPVLEFKWELSKEPSPHAYHGDTFDLQAFNQFVVNKGKELLEKYDRIIWIDADSIMCAPCPDLFGDFDMGVPHNNWPYLEIANKDLHYANAGMVVGVNKDTWQEWIDELKRFDDRFHGAAWDVLNFNNSLNKVYHDSKANIKLLEFEDRVYGISKMDTYKEMSLKDEELWINEKKLCIFHAAGDEWKDCLGKIRFDRITDKEAAKYLESLQGKEANEQN